MVRVKQSNPKKDKGKKESFVFVKDKKNPSAKKRKVKDESLHPSLREQYQADRDAAYQNVGSSSLSRQYQQEDNDNRRARRYIDNTKRKYYQKENFFHIANQAHAPPFSIVPENRSQAVYRVHRDREIEREERRIRREEEARRARIARTRRFLVIPRRNNNNGRRAPPSSP